MKTHDNLGYFYIIPYVIVFLIFSIYPIFNTLYLSFTDYAGYGDPKWVGVKNYYQVIKPDEAARQRSIELKPQLDMDLVRKYKIDKLSANDVKTKYNITDENLFQRITAQKALLDEIIKGENVYKGVLRDKYFWGSFLNTWRLWLPNIIMQLGLAFMVAVWFTDVRLKLKFVSVFRAIYYFPNLVTVASLAILFTVLFDFQNGAINQLLFGTTQFAKENTYINWMIIGWRAQLIISVIQTWIWFGNSTIFVMAGLNGIPETYYEAAVVDGANSWQTFWKITIPLIQPVLIFLVITSLIGGMQIFDLPWVLTNGSGFPDNQLMTMVMYLFRTAFRFERMGYAAAIAYILFLIIVVFSILSLRVFAEANPKQKKKKAA
jgi:multiple sugar transport system permease protein